MKIKPIQVKGNGTSLWGKSDEVYTVDKIILNYNNQNNEHCAEDFGKSFWGEIQMFGPNTKWFHYTDKAISEKLNTKQFVKVITGIIEKELGKKITDFKISWSEQGMQSEKGWSFDVSAKII